MMISGQYVCKLSLFPHVTRQCTGARRTYLSPPNISSMHQQKKYLNLSQKSDYPNMSSRFKQIISIFRLTQDGSNMLQLFSHSVPFAAGPLAEQLKNTMGGAQDTEKRHI